MAQSIIKKAENPVTFSIFSDGEKVKSTNGLISIWIRKEINKIGKVTLEIESRNLPQNEIIESNKDTFLPGKKIRIDAGYQGNETCLFEGIVSTHHLVILEDGTSLKIECRDFAFPMSLTRQNRKFNDKSDKEMMAEILKSYPGLKPKITDTQIKHQEMLQCYCTDWDFLLSRADSCGLLVITEKDKIKIKAPNTKEKAIYSIRYGVDLVEFNGELQAANQVENIEAIGWDPAKQELLTATSSVPSLNKQGNVSSSKLATAINGGTKVLNMSNCSDIKKLQSWADAQGVKIALSRIQGNIKCIGNPFIQPDSIVEIEGFGDRFNGNVYVGAVEHQFESTQWTTKIEMGVPCSNITENQQVEAPSASGYLPGIKGLHIGKVLKLAGDPSRENRIQVNIPTLNIKEGFVWARLLQISASQEYGTFFIPNLEDEVVVGFFNNDPCQAVILGSLYSSKLKPPYPFTSNNSKKAIVTTSKIKLEFDDEKKTISLITPGKNTMVIDDDSESITLHDQHNNELCLNQDGITMKSAKDIILKAQRNITIECMSKTSIKATQDAILEGMNVNIEAKMGVTVKGSTTAELSASGQTTVKGAMVMIN
ncbi:MAG: type VI secretion system tip protein VgrG [Bacteroidales bacterium]